MSQHGEAYARDDSGRHLEERDPGQDRGGSSNQEISIAIELNEELRGELLDPATWSSILSLYAQSMRLAVALVDADGHMVGACHNAQPIWSLARNAKPEPAGDCLFCLETAHNCTARTSAIESRSLTLAHDQAGFAHVVYPLVLSGQVVGTLLAGQVLDRYPEPLPLQRLARTFGLSPQQVWDLARHIAPIGTRNLSVYGELLGALGQTVLRDRYGAILEKRSIKNTKTLNRQLADSNLMLETKVVELDRSHSDLENLLDSSETVSMVLDNSSHVERYTAAAGTLLKLYPSDVGQHVKGLESRFAEAGLPDLIGDIKSILPISSAHGRGAIREQDVTASNGKHYLSRILPYYNSRNVVDGLVITFIEVTKLKEAERLASEARSYAEHIVDTVREPLLVLDKDFRVISGNESFYTTFRVSAAETVGRVFYEIGNGRWDIPVLRRLLSEVVDKQTQMQDFVVAQELAGEGVKTMLLNARPIEAANLILLAIEDITERKRLENQLREMNLNLEMFSQAAAHDLQEPLRTINLSGQLLAQDYRSKVDSEAGEYITNIVEASNRLETLLRDLRQYWLVSEKTRQSEIVDSVQVLEKTLNDLAVPIKESGAKVSYDVLPPVAVEAVSLGMLFQNLVGNAIKYRRPGVAPSVHISAQKKMGKWCFSVADDGIGIEPKNLERIFAPFKRLHGKLYPGSGIGLALCEKIVKRYGGELWVESLYGQGSTFYFTIPARAQVAEATGA